MSRATLKARLEAAHPVSVARCDDCRELAALLAVADAAKAALDASGLPDAIDARDRLVAALDALEALP